MHGARGRVIQVRRDRLIELRVSAGFSQETLAEAMNVDRSTVGRWERGRATPQPWQVPKLADLLKTTSDALGPVLHPAPPGTPDTGEHQALTGARRPETRPTGDGPPQPATPAAAEMATTALIDGGVRVGCRTADGQIVFVTMPRQLLPHSVSTTANPTSLPGLPQPGVQALPSLLSHGLHPVEGMRALRRSLVECDNVLGPRGVIATAQEHVQVIQHLRREATGDDRRALLQLLAEYAEFCAWLHQDGGDHRAAQHWAALATDWAAASGDHDLTAYITARKAQLAGDMKESADAVDLADYAQRLTRPGSRLSAMAAVYGAHGYALLGDERSAQHALDQALALITDPSEAPIGRGRWLDATYVEAQRARALAVLGRHHEAVSGFEQAIESLPVNFRRDRGVYLARAAISQLVAYGPEPAAETAEAALSIAVSTGSARILTELATLDGMLQRCQSVPEVRHFREVLDSHLLHEV
ncbi:helix-turn-helix transcriptional regulator [Kitasatospora saccharophila]|uniref:helix-turn-helix transcriptional regulator n=1 Tax=Kitasatospora saccharophila TaxID=407973 RepID=UPI0031E30A38